MRLSNLLVLLMLAPAAGGCARLPPPRVAAQPVTVAPQATTARAADFENPMYRAAAPKVVPDAAPVAAPVATTTLASALARLFERRRPAPMDVVAATPAPAPKVVPAAAPVAAPVATMSLGSALARLFERRRPAPTDVVVAPTPTPTLTATSALASAPPSNVVAVTAAMAEGELPYTLDTGDRLRVVVFGQEGLTSSYVVDAQGNLSMPLIGTVAARAQTTEQLSRLIADRLRRGFIREPHVSIEVEIYRPFFILGEVTAPGQYPYVPNMTVQTAVAIAGGFTPRAYRWDISVDRPASGGVVRQTVPPLTRIKPGDTVIVKERWF